MEFLNYGYFLLLLIIPLFFLIKNKNLPFSKDVIEKIIIKSKISKKTKFYILLLAYLLIIIALARPVTNQKNTTIKAPNENVVIALDISQTMRKKDLYPNRVEFAKNKIDSLLKNISSLNVALIAFDQNSYLISPLTLDYSSVEYLLKHTDFNEMRITNTSNLIKLINAASNLGEISYIVAFTANIDQNAIKYAKEKGIKLIIYNTSKTKINLKNVFNAQYSQENIKKIAKLLTSNKQKEFKIKTQKELFIYPLGLSVILIFFVMFFPLRRKG